ncbi:MAG: DUF349 domain-containing protein [Bacteroidales bacterium]|nr:DUF349 domain-containing protein [Bacteroidales bacterium]
MEMQDPKLEAQAEITSSTTNDAEAPATEAGINNPADSAAEPEVEVEIIMADEAAEAADEVAAAHEPRRHTVESLLETAKALLEKNPADLTADEIRRLRQHYSNLHKSAAEAVAENAEVEAAEDAGVSAEDVPAANLELENAIEELRARKAAWTAEQEAMRAANLERKNAIIAEIISLGGDTDNVNRTFPRYRELQDEFNAIGDVDPTEETALWKRFQEARERYSDNLKINKELRDYDFKKNLDEKQALLEEARTLSNEEDVIAAYRRLQELHVKWRQIGPVAKELRDEIWNSFRDASAAINSRYQAYFEARKAREAENEAAKTALCEEIEALDLAQLKSYVAWDAATKTIQDLQARWRELGFASKKNNRALFQRFRAACDAFFAAKAEYYRATREEQAANLARKQALTARAEELKDSTDWRKATDAFVEMQKEWKTIGSAGKKQGDALWARFTAACDAFFARKKAEGNGTRKVEADNLKAKREIIGLLSALVSDDAEKNTAIAELRKLQARWNEIGHVPFREKDKLREAYRSAVDAVRRHFDIAESRARRERFEAGVAQMEGDDNKLMRERERLVRALEGRRNDLRTYQNNLGFLSAKSKSGNSLMQDMERRIDRLKADIDELCEKIAVLDGKLG